jgi:transcriptional regulator GlxA family with amidase domain
MHPGQFVDRMPGEAAQQMIDSSSIGLKEIADACGFKTVDSMRRTFPRPIRVSLSTYASRFRRAVNRHRCKTWRSCIAVRHGDRYRSGG